MKRHWYTTGRALFVASALALAGADPAGAKSLRLASAFDPQSMDPHALALLYQTRIAMQIYESLVGRDRDFKLENRRSRCRGRRSTRKPGASSCAPT